MKVWFFNECIDIEIGQKVLIARYGSGHSYFGEFGKFERATDSHLVFVTDSGAIVKTERESLNTIGKAKKAGYWVSTRVEDRENDKNFIKLPVSYWNNKKCCLEYK